MEIQKCAKDDSDPVFQTRLEDWEAASDGEKPEVLRAGDITNRDVNGRPMAVLPGEANLEDVRLVCPKCGAASGWNLSVKVAEIHADWNGRQAKERKYAEIRRVLSNL